jgi:hypothetical protein
LARAAARALTEREIKGEDAVGEPANDRREGGRGGGDDEDRADARLRRRWRGDSRRGGEPCVIGRFGVERRRWNPLRPTLNGLLGL